MCSSRFFLLLGAAAVVYGNYTLPRIELGKKIEVTGYELKYASHHLYVDKENKLVYCAIPKVACTEFARLIFRLKGKNKDKGRWLQDPHFRQDKPLLKDLGPDEATRIMNDPTWTKFVFFRDPIERLLSAWTDKFVHGQKYMTKSYSVRFYNKPNLTFPEFVDLIAAPPAKKRSDFRGLGPYSNAHWRPQRFMCGLDKFLPLYNFIGSFNSLREHTEMLLRATSLWDDYGATGWGSNGRYGLNIKARRSSQQLKSLPIFAKNVAWHRASKSDRKTEYLTPDLVEKLKRAYWQDYDMLNRIGWNDDLPVDGRPWFNRSALVVVGGGLLCQLDRAFCEKNKTAEALKQKERDQQQKKRRPPPPRQVLRSSSHSQHRSPGGPGSAPQQLRPPRSQQHLSPHV